jgi:hypothetical protein
MVFSFVGRFPDHRPKRIIGDWHATMFAASRIDDSAPASQVPNCPTVPAKWDIRSVAYSATPHGPTPETRWGEICKTNPSGQLSPGGGN